MEGTTEKPAYKNSTGSRSLKNNEKVTIPEKITDVENGTQKGTKFRKMYLAAFAALLSAVAAGNALGYSSPATHDIQRLRSRIKVTKDDVTWIGSLLALGGLIGGVAAAHLSNTLGRKGTLILNSIPFVLGWLLIAYAQNVAMIFAGRILTGICCGFVTVTAPMYIVEISTPEIRGLLGSSFQLFIVIGVSLTMIIGDDITWDMLAIPCCVVSILALLAICPMPESPRWLVSKGKSKAATRAIEFMQGDHLNPEEECANIENDLKHQPKGGLTIQEVSQPTVYKPALLTLGLMFFQQFSGVNAIMFYTESIFKDAGSTMNPSIAAIIVSLVQVAGTFVSTLVIDKAGRKLLLIVSGAGMFISLLVMGIFMFLVEKQGTDFQHKYGWLPLASLMIYIASFAFGYGPVPWLMSSELIPVRARSTFGGIATGMNWLFAFIITKTFDSMSNEMKPYGCYWFYACISLVGCFFVWFLLPETKGKKLEDIQEFFLRRDTSHSFRELKTT